MAETINGSTGRRLLLSAACFVVVVAGMKAAAGILLPFLLALFIAIICMPVLGWLRRIKIPNALAVLIIIIGIAIMMLLIGTLAGTSISQFSENLPEYQRLLEERSSQLFSWLGNIGIHVSAPHIGSYFETSSVMKLATNTLAVVSSLLSNAFVILLTIIFILFEAAGFPAKLQEAFGSGESSTKRFDHIVKSINRYLAIKTFFALATGILIALWLYIIGVDYPLLWGLLAFLLNYIPSIGSFIAAIPPILLTLIQFGMGPASLTALGYIVVNAVLGSFFEPKVMGQKLGLSTLIVFLSLIFWGWVLGPVGMFLSVPLTVILKIGLESDEEKKWIAILMS